MVSKKEKYLVSAQKFIERGQLDKAVAELARVIEDDPKDTRTLLKLAEVHAKRGANPEAAEIYLRTGDLYAEQGFAQKAVAVYKNVLKLSPGNLAAHLKVATLFNQLGLLSDAVQQFELAATALQRGNKAAEAVAALRQAMEIQPDNVVLRVKLAEGASLAGLVDEAVREFGIAANQLRALGRIDDSLRVMERLLFHQPDNFEKSRELADAYIARGTPRLALAKLQACLKLNPRDPSTLSLLARALEMLGQIPKAVSVLKELVRLCEELGRTSDGEAAVLRGLTLDPADPDLLAAAARLEMQAAAGAAGNATPGPRSAGVAAFVGRPNPEAGVVPRRSSTGAVAVAGGGVAPGLAGGNAASREAASSVSLSIQPDMDRVLAEADVFVKYGLLERAADHLGRALDSEPEHREAREELVAVLHGLGRHEEAHGHSALLGDQAESMARARSGASRDFDESRDGSRGVSLDPDPDLDSDPDSGWDSDPRRSAPGYPSGGSVLSLASSGDEEDDPAADQVTPPPIIQPAAPEFGQGQDRPRSADRSVSREYAVTDEDIDDTHEMATLDQWGAFQPLEKLQGVRPAPDLPGGQAIGLVAPQPREDPARAFSEDVPTTTGDPDLVVALPAAVNEEDLASELEQVSFFLDQSLTDEARALLKDLQTRYPGDPRLGAKERQLRDTDFREIAQSSESIATARIAHHPTGPRATIRRPSALDSTPAPRVVVSGGASDSSTHADLAIAYKGMGLLDAAIAELKLLAEDPAREVFALTTMGECFEGKGTFTEAIIRYKRALNCEQITAEETLALYFLLGAAFERLGDVSEALYFFEKVLKRDRRFREVDRRVADLRPRLVKRAR